MGSPSSCSYGTITAYFPRRPGSVQRPTVSGQRSLFSVQPDSFPYHSIFFQSFSIHTHLCFVSRIPDATYRRTNRALLSFPGLTFLYRFSLFETSSSSFSSFRFSFLLSFLLRVNFPLSLPNPLVDHRVCGSRHLQASRQPLPCRRYYPSRCYRKAIRVRSSRKPGATVSGI